MTEAIRIGDRASDRISGFIGIVTGRTEYLNGCRQFLVRKEGLKDDGTVWDGMWIDEQNLRVKDAQVLPDPFPTVQRVAAVAGGPDRKERSTL